jgi:hypothetical protein
MSAASRMRRHRFAIELKTAKAVTLAACAAKRPPLRQGCCETRWARQSLPEPTGRAPLAPNTKGREKSPRWANAASQGT